jgi:cytochrome c oxidase assembly protein subunit 15
LSATLAGAFVIWLVVQARRRGSGRLATVLLTLLGVQFVLGVADVVLLAPVWMQILHLLGADLYWIALIALSADLVWAPAAGDRSINVN